MGGDVDGNDFDGFGGGGGVNPMDIFSQFFSGGGGDPFEQFSGFGGGGGMPGGVKFKFTTR